MKIHGIAVKTFFFTFFLLIIIILFTFGTLYFVMPSYYLNKKNKILNKNVDILGKNLIDANTDLENINLLKKFVQDNNADIISYDNSGNILPFLSSPLITMDDDFEKNLIVITDDSMDTDKANRIYFSLEINQDESNILVFENQIQNIIEVEREINNKFIANIYATSTLQPIDEASSVLLSLISYLFILDIIIIIIGSYIYSKKITDPILKITKATTKMKELNKNTLSSIRTNDEIGILSQNIDSLYMLLCENINNLKSEMIKANKAEQSKSDFIRAASHELKTPIAVLNGILEGMIDNIGIYKNHDKYLVESKKKSEQLNDLVDEILNVSFLENELDIFVEEIDIENSINNILDSYELLIQDKHLKITKNINNFVYSCDNKLLTHTISNLISNAIKYTPEKKEIRISLNNNNDYIFSIENQCESIDENDLTKLLEPFYTLTYSRDKSVSGTGLGLYIVKRNLETLGLKFDLFSNNFGFKFIIFFDYLLV